MGLFHGAYPIKRVKVKRSFSEQTAGKEWEREEDAEGMNGQHTNVKANTRHLEAEDARLEEQRTGSVRGRVKLVARAV